VHPHSHAKEKEKGVEAKVGGTEEREEDRHKGERTTGRRDKKKGRERMRGEVGGETEKDVRRSPRKRRGLL